MEDAFGRSSLPRISEIKTERLHVFILCFWVSAAFFSRFIADEFTVNLKTLCN